MLYKVIGLMSGSSLDGLDIVYAHFEETAGQWTYELRHTDCHAYSAEWVDKLKNAERLPALDYQLLHVAYGRFIGEQVNRFIEENNLQYQVQLIASHGHTTFHLPKRRMTAQLGDGAAIAANTNINVISDLRSMDIALGGQGAPIVPIGEHCLLGEYDFFLNLGGIANISAHIAPLQRTAPDPGDSGAGDRDSRQLQDKLLLAFDVCPANRVLNTLANEAGEPFDRNGTMARSGAVNDLLLEKLNRFGFYQAAYPKSLSNDFGMNEIYPLIKDSRISIPDALATYTEHIAIQVSNAIATLFADAHRQADAGLPGRTFPKLLATGGGAHNIFLIGRLKELMHSLGVELIVADDKLIDYKEALIIAFIGVLRWRDENNVLSSVTGASRSSVGGAVWIGQG